MQTMRESWTDERLDDLNAKVDRGFDRIDKRFDRIDERFERLEQRLDERFDGLYRLMLWFCGSALVALIGLVASLIGVVATQL